MKPIKIRVRSPEHSEVIQKMLFAIGCKWGLSGQVVKHTQMPFLYAFADDEIVYYGGSEVFFNEDENQEVSFDWLFPPRETIEIDGFGKFYKDEVEECLDRLERVE